MVNSSQQLLLDPLTEREMEVLRLLAEGCTNREIAQRLFVAPETVKWYNKQIFSKLGVSSRGEAGSRADELGLFDDADASSPRHNLPVEFTPFIGRIRQLNEISLMVADDSCHVVTLLGPGGIGKTRLGLRAAQQHLSDFEDGVFLVPLDGVGSPDLLVSAIASALKVHFNQMNQPKEQLIRYLCRKHLMLVLDGFEKLVEGSELLTEIATAAPGLQILVTSRVRLNLLAECVYPVEGLDVPIGGENDTFEEVEAVQVFATYARRARPDFALGDDDQAAVAEICNRVGGSPLGLELAATWVRALSPGDIAAKLEVDLDMLDGGIRDLPTRQRSVRATFEYSWRMLTPEQQAALRGLAVFQGGFTRDAAKAVAGVRAAQLGALVDQSLIRISPDGRYSMHELIRQYAEEKLTEIGEETAIRDAHAAYFVELAEQSSEGLQTGKHEWLTRMDAEIDNLRAVMTWLLENEDAEHAVRAAAALSQYHEWQGLDRESYHWLEQALAIDRPLAPRGRATGLRRLGVMVVNLGMGRDRFAALMEEALAIYRDLGDQEGIAKCLNNLGLLAGAKKDYEGALDLFEEALELNRASNDARGVAFVQRNKANLFARHLGDFTTARTYLEESSRLGRELENQLFIQGCLIGLIRLDLYEGDYEKALARVAEMEAIEEKINSFDVHQTVQVAKGLVSLRMGNPLAACSVLRKILSESYEQGDLVDMIQMFTGLAASLLALGDAQRAVQVFGATDALGDRLGQFAPVRDNWFYHDDLAAARDALGKEAFEAAWAAGREMDLDQAVACALEEVSNH